MGMMLILAYLLEFIKGERTLTYFLMFLAAAAIPLLISWFFYLRNKESGIVKYLCAVLFMVLYIFVLFTGDTPMVSLYIWLIIILLMSANDKKLILAECIAAVLVNAVSIGYNVLILNKNTPDEIANSEIQFLGILLYGIFAYAVLSTLVKLNKEKVETISGHEATQRKLLQEINIVSAVIEKNTSSMVTEIASLNEASTKTSATMDETVDAMTQTRTEIERQLVMVDGIQQIIEKTTSISNETSEMVSLSKDNVFAGMEHMKELSQTASETKNTGFLVMNQMKELKETTEEVKNIITMIGGIATQTNLLALNASIEAARAGTAGKGFAVVADEINTLSAQTKDATNKISEMIKNLQSRSEAASEAVSVMTELNNKQNEAVVLTETAFRTIESSISKVSVNTEQQKDSMSQLLAANDKITTSINDISVTSRKVMSGTQATQKISGENLEIASLLTNSARELMGSIEKLSNNTKK